MGFFKDKNGYWGTILREKSPSETSEGYRC